MLLSLKISGLKIIKESKLGFTSWSFYFFLIGLLKFGYFIQKEYETNDSCNLMFLPFCYFFSFFYM
jgi:hypothetical protein